MAEKKDKKSEVAKREEEILKFWQDNKIFEKTLEKESPEGEFVFYDGPPFATGLPHYGHVLPGTMKDIIPRYKTMRGYHVPRRWGWDCHGLPLENQVEKELGLEGKKDIEEYGIDAFNETAKKFVLRYADDWKEIIPRTGRWVDMENDYRTMDASYTESIWWAFKELFDKGLIYEGFKSMHICPRCETPLSNFEVNQGYADIKDLSVTVALPLENDPGVSLLIWTTTPWTLPGNMAAAVNKGLDYAKVKTEGGVFIVAKDLVEKVFEGKEYEIKEEVKGKKLVGLTYKPPFDYFKDKDIKNKENAWKVYDADYVSLEEGTGVVHLAPAFGAEDLELAQKEGIPIVHHVDNTGRFTPEVVDLAGMQVKPKEDHMSTDIEIIKLLAADGTLFGKEKITHSYPLCWRCDTPLLNYATSSWFVEVTKIKDRLIKENKDVRWVPKEIGQNRFGDWLEGARDWAISRSRYWGAPLPVWKCEECEEVFVPGSVSDLKDKTGKSGNKYFVMRHGEAEHNLKGVITRDPEGIYHLTDRAKDNIKTTAESLSAEKIDLILASPVLRTKETAEMMAESLDLKESEIVYDERIFEINPGEYEGKPVEEYHKLFVNDASDLEIKPEKGESFLEVKRRVGDFLYDTDQKYKDKNILIITHSGPAWMLFSAAEALSAEESLDLHKGKGAFIEPGEVRELDFVSIPHNKYYELDFHLPYIDEVSVSCACGGKMERVKEVFDCWFESGSMSYASHHYPFKKDDFNPKENKGYPADFIAEGLDQTRGWFYSLLVLGVALFDKSPYENVVVNGMVLAEDGKKMSKRLKNYPEIDYVLDKYGADALRYFLVSSPLVKAESVNFSEKEVDEIVKKIILRLKNILSFYEMYADTDSSTDNQQPSTENVLDKWILSRLTETTAEVTKNLDRYEFDRAARPFLDFIDDFSTWYLRRSRDRFKADGEDSLSAATTTRFVLLETVKILAPFMPFVTEDIYQKLGGEKESVHLEDWPTLDEREKIKDESEILEEMQEVRRVVSLALEARASEGIKVRQPLSRLKIKDERLKGREELLELVRDEVNVKEVVFDDSISEEVELNTEITEELKREGQARDLIRQLQSMRKNAGLSPDETVSLEVETSKDGKSLIEKFEDEIKSTANIKDFEFRESLEGETLDLEDLSFNLKLI